MVRSCNVKMKLSRWYCKNHNQKLALVYLKINIENLSLVSVKMAVNCLKRINILTKNCLGIGDKLMLTARRFNELPSVSRLACVFALNAEVLTKAGKVPVDERKFLVTIKLSRWRGLDKWAGFVTS